MTDQNSNWFDQNAPGAAPQQGQPAPQQAAPAPTPAPQPAGNWFDQNPAPAATPAAAETEEKAAPAQPQGLWDKIKTAVAGPTTALGTPLGEDQSQELSGLGDILQGNVKQGAGKIWNSEKIDAKNIVPGSPAEWAIRQFDPDFHGGATKEAIAAMKAKNPNAGEKPLLDVAQFIDMKKHPIGKALTEVAQGFTSPENIAIMYGTGGLGLIGQTPKALKAFGTMSRLISAGFAYQALQGAYEHSKAFKEAFDAGDEERAEYELTHAVAGGVIGTQAATHAAEGLPLPGYDKGGKGNAVKPLVELSPTEKKVAGAISTAVGHAADATKNFTAEKLQAATDRVGVVFGRTADFDEAVTRVANMMGKKAGPEFKEKVSNASDDLKQIINEDTTNKIVDPETAAQAVDRHIQGNIEAPLLQEAHATKDSTEPVVPDFKARLNERLDKFFDENAGKYGSPEEEDVIKQRILDRMDRDQDLGNGVKIAREPNLYEAENIRQGLNKEAGSVFEQGTSSGYRAAAAETSNFMREVIDESYKANGVQGVPDARAKEADLIDIRDALRDAQGRFEAQKATPALLKLFSLGKLAGMVGAVGAHFFGSDILGGALAAGSAWKAIHEHNVSNLEGNLERARQLAAREQGASATVPEFNQTPVPPPAGPAGAQIPPNMPPRPTPPQPATRPAVNHTLNGELASYFSEDRATSPEEYNGLLDRFKEKFATMKQSVADLKAKGQELPEAYKDEWKQANELHATIQKEGAKEDAALEKENKKRQDKYVKDSQDWTSQLQTETQKQAELTRQQKDAESQAKIQEEKARVDAILKDERVAHSPLMKSTDEAQPIEGVEGRSSKELHRHEHGHIMANVAEGLNPFTFVAAEHPDAVESGAAAQVHTDVSGAEEGPKGIAQRVVGILGGPAFDEVHQGITIGRNTGARADISRAREILREEGGLKGNQLEKVFDALYDRAKEHVSNPEALALVDANADLREAGLHKNFHMSPGRMEEYVKKLKGAYRNGETPSTEGVREGDSDGGVPQGESAGTGNGGSEQDGAVERTRTEAARKSDEGAEAAAAREERSSVKAAMPPERSTGDAELDKKIKSGGAIPAGRFGPLAMFHHPETGSTLALKPEEITPEAVKEHVAKSTEKYTQGDIRNTARQYNEVRGLPEVNPAPVTEDPRVQEMGRVYDELKHNPNDPKVEASYKAFKNELDHQYDALTKAGFKFDTSKEDPYPSYDAMRQDILRNKHLTAWEGAAPPADHPLAERDPKTGFTYNEKFRLVHDVLGHAAHDADFSGNGEESAWNYHRQMFSPEAQPALAAETRGQVASFTRNGKFPDTQKAVLMPDAYNMRPEDIMKSSLSKTGGNAIKKLENSNEEFARPIGYDSSKPFTNKTAPAVILPDGRIIPARLSHADIAGEAGFKDDFDGVQDLLKHTDGVRVMYPDRGRGNIGIQSHANPNDVQTGTVASVLKHAAEAGIGDGKNFVWDLGAPGKDHVSGSGTINDYRRAIESKGVEKSNLNWAKKVEDEPFGGVNPNDPEAPSKKYAFELSPENRHTPEKLTAQEAQAFAERPDVKELLATHPDIKLGWDTTTQGRPELNIGVSTNDLDTAKKVAGKLDQRAIVDTQTGDEISAGGTGTKTEFPDYPLADRLKDLGIEKSDIAKSPKGSSVPLMENPLPVKGTMEGNEVGTLDLTKALNAYSRKQLPSLEPGSEPKEMVDRAKKIAEDEAKYQLAQSKTGTEWYTTEMKDHDKVLTDLRPELLTGPETTSEAPWTHTAKMTLFKAAEAILSSGQKPYANVKSALRAWDAYNETGEFPRSNPATGKEGMSWGPRGVNAYGSAFDSLNKLIQEKGEKGAADWLLSEHPVKELRSYQSEGQSPVKGKADENETGAMILGAKRGPFMQNLHGIESKFTADMWVSRSWNRWMGTLDLDPRIENKGKMTSESDAPRNNTERTLMNQSFSETANKLGLTTSSLQAVLWYYEQALYRAHGLPVESWSFSDAAKRVGKEASAPPEAEQTGFGFGANENTSPKEAGFRGLTAPELKNGSAVHALDLINALKK